MPRKGNVAKRDVLPDPIYNSKLVTRLINKIMYDGKKGTAQDILYGAFELIEKKTQKPAMDVFATAINNIMPEVELKAKRIGAANYQVPTEVSPERKVTLGLRWLVNYSRLRKEKSMKERLANEIIDAANNTGASVKKREDTIKMAEANKAYAHYKW
ncbi:MAG: 30S ribosomal protein S7 [Bacillales bacterium]